MWKERKQKTTHFPPSKLALLSSMKDSDVWGKREDKTEISKTKHPERATTVQRNQMKLFCAECDRDQQKLLKRTMNRVLKDIFRREISRLYWESFYILTKDVEKSISDQYIYIGID